MTYLVVIKGGSFCCDCLFVDLFDARHTSFFVEGNYHGDELMAIGQEVCIEYGDNGRQQALSEEKK